MTHETADTASSPADTERVFGLSLAFTARLATLGVIGVILMAFLTVVDIASRELFHASFFGLNEVSALTVAVCVAMCLPASILKRAPLAIELLTSHLQGPAASWTRAVGSAGMFLFLIVIAWQVGLVANHTMRTHETTILTGISVYPFYYAIAALLWVCVAGQALILGVDLAAARRTSGGGMMANIAVAAVILVVIALVAVILGWMPGLPIKGWLTSNRVGIAALMFLLMWVLSLTSIPLGAAMGLTGLIGSSMLLNRDASLAVVGSEVKHLLIEPSLAVLPFFLLMGMFASLAGLGADLYRLAAAVFGHVRGGLANATIAGCAAFGSLTGSSMATQLTVGRIAMPEMEKRGYSPALAAGAMAAGGTLGQLIPPSTAMILYCVLAEESVGRMFMGAVLPGLLATLLYMTTVFIWAWINPKAAPSVGGFDLAELAASLRGCWAAVLLLGAVLGGIYSGAFTEMEAGSVGVVGTAILAVARRKLTFQTFWGVMSDATVTVGIMYTLLFGVAVLSFMFGISGLPAFFIDIADHFNLSAHEVVIMLIVIYLVLGTAMDSWAIMVITVPIFTPLVTSYGYDPIWWGIMVIMCMEAGQISPPFGLNIFIMKSIAPSIPLGQVYKGCTAFFGSTVVKIILLILFPAIVTWLPGTM
ncbi:TRAP transporter large permease subunit [Gemmobacter sp.]|uniref:TRAP transporter large permease n=1 Tax=Gemmobacter sp. TaxID=1898957 RepID=UPI002B000037|nr:TRAP transporter large permease subunit [Gemmobacter sp.]